MTYRPFPKDRTVTGAQARLQDGAETSIRGTFDSLGGTPAQGKLLQDISVTTTGKAIPHYLGKKPTGVILVADSAGVSYLKTTNFTKSTVTITSNVDATVSLWVF